jgi:isoquinoline 1-oxidoreductase subunit beta
VFDTVVKKSGWATAPKGRSRGFAMAVANGSVVAHVAEISVSKANEVRVHRVTCVADCGLVVNPGSVTAQMQGGTIFGLTAAFLGEITVGNGRVQQSNFHDYPLVTMAQAPEIDVTILDSGEKAGGAGEEAVAGVAPAVANALFAATGRRVRRLPLAREGFTLV